jgi:hypothetical protein
VVGSQIGQGIKRIDLMIDAINDLVHMMLMLLHYIHILIYMTHTGRTAIARRRGQDLSRRTFHTSADNVLAHRLGIDTSQNLANIAFRTLFIALGKTLTVPTLFQVATLIVSTIVRNICQAFFKSCITGGFTRRTHWTL